MKTVEELAKEYAKKNIWANIDEAFIAGWDEHSRWITVEDALPEWNEESKEYQIIVKDKNDKKWLMDINKPFDCKFYYEVTNWKYID